tara:strand:- start:442 stop:732 length:291 start_codon:yes stop_codon:yes gene_type:complete
MIPYIYYQKLRILVENGKKLLIVNYNIYDVTNYYKYHPGGKCIIKNVIRIDKNKLKLKDSSIDFNFHSYKSKKVWEKLLIGTIQKKWYHYFFNIIY